MPLCVGVDWEIEREDVGRRDYEGYRVIEININEATKEVWSVTFTYIWDCGDGCCSSTEREIAYVGSMSQHLKEKVLQALPDYKLQGYRWSRSSI